MKSYLISLFLIVLVVASSCDDPIRNQFQNDYSTVPDPFSVEGKQKVTLPNGLVFYEIEVGEGEFQVVERDRVETHYTGRTPDDDIFDSTYANGNVDPIEMNLGGINLSNGQFNLIEGFRLGYQGMKVGGKRKIVIPPDLGYGGTSNRLANDTLIFDVELFEIISR